MIEGGINTTIIKLSNYKFNNVCKGLFGLQGGDVEDTIISYEDVESYMEDGEIIALRYNQSNEHIFSQLNVETNELTIFNASKYIGEVP